VNYVVSSSYFCSALLAFAVFPLPYGYYGLLRFCVTAVAIYCAYDSYKKKAESYYLIWFLFVAVLFNPIIPIYFDKTIWAGIDVFLACAFFWYGKNYKEHEG
jgi:hypothetical protein